MMIRSTIDTVEAYIMEGGRAGTGSKPCTRRREVPTRALKALPKALLATRGLPKDMQRTSASGYSNAAHVAPTVSGACCVNDSDRDCDGFSVTVFSLYYVQNDTSLLLQTGMQTQHSQDTAHMRVKRVQALPMALTIDGLGTQQLVVKRAGNMPPQEWV